MWTKHAAHALLAVLATMLQVSTGEALESCPSRAAVERELLPLLGETSVQLETSAAARIEDLGESYRVSVNGAARLISDPLRDCDERAKVSAVFIALNLPPRSVPQTPRAPAAVPQPEGVMARPHWRLQLRALASFEHAPEPEGLATGLTFGGALRQGALGVALSAGVQTPVTLGAHDGQAGSYELWRLPAAVTLGYVHEAGRWGAGFEGGLALDLLRFRGVSLPNPDAGVRLNAGLRGSLVVRLRASRTLAALLLPTLAFYPRTYLVRLEPTRLLGESPRFWWGVGIGLESSVLGG